MYICRRCGHEGEAPSRKYEPDCLSSAVCENCGSDDIKESCVSCDICGKALFGGDTAYEINEMLICPVCTIKVTI